jgi:hypothetical protein
MEAAGLVTSVRHTVRLSIHTAVALSAAVCCIGTAGAQPASLLRNAPCARPIATTPPRISWAGPPSTHRVGSWSVRVGRPSISLRLIVVRIEPTAFRWTLDVQRAHGTVQPWSLSAVADSVTIAMNAGQFTDDGPWGWLVHDRAERQAPGAGALAGAVTIRANGRVELHDADAIPTMRGDSSVIEALQSYPTLLDARAEVPAALCRSDNGVDPTHRDIRFAIGTDTAGAVWLVLSRLETDVPFADRTPIGPTTREMATALRSLGATRAILLDGGLSAQLLVRSGDTVQRWPGLRAVPLGLVLVRRK